MPPRFVPNHDLLTDLACQTDAEGWIAADPTGRTGVGGVWVAGNVVDPRAQQITAAGAGSATTIALNADLVDEDVRRAVHDFELGLPLNPTAHTNLKESSCPTLPTLQRSTSWR